MVKIMSVFQDPSKIGNCHLWAKKKFNFWKLRCERMYYLQILFSRIEALNPLLATVDVELVSNAMNIWFLGIEISIFL